jgi:dynein heavy chain
VKQILKILGKLEANVMVDRKEGKTYELEEYQQTHEAVIGNRHNDVLDGSEEIHALVLKSNKVLRISKGAPSWKAYQDYIAGIVVEGLSVAVQASMDEMMNQLDEVYMQKQDISALLEVRLDLLEVVSGEYDILYTPSIDPVKGPELRECVMGWVKDFMNIAKFVARLDTQVRLTSIFSLATHFLIQT